MDKFIDKLVDIVKLSPRFLFLPLLLISSFALFVPAVLLDWLSVAQLIQENRVYFGAAFIISGAFILAALIGSTFDAVRGAYSKRQKHAKWLKAHQKRLHNLTEIEKDYLRAYLEEDTPTQNFDFDDGVAKGLEATGIIFQSSPMGSLLEGFAYNIQPWARDYLKKHSELLASADLTRKSQRPKPGSQRRW